MSSVEPCPRCGGLMRVGMYFDIMHSRHVPVLMCPVCGYDYYLLLLPFPCLPEEIIGRWNNHARNYSGKKYPDKKRDASEYINKP